MKNKPIKRNAEMVELSKDHHAGLLFCWKVKEGLKKDIELYRIKKYVNYFWNQHLKQHFQEEEALLFNRIDDSLSRQGIAEHQMLVNRINQLNHHENEKKDEYAAFTELLTSHIRFEERVLFPHLEANLSDSALRNIGEYLVKQHPAPFKDNYPDEFWTDKKQF
jgi:hemerythrin-like domain-containing protein